MKCDFVRSLSHLKTAASAFAMLMLCLPGFWTNNAAAQSAVTSTITSISTTDTAGSSTLMSGPGAGTSAFASGTTYNLTYQGSTRSIDSFSSGGTNYAPLAYGGTVSTTLVRNGVGQDNNLLWSREISSVGNSYTLAAPYIGSEQTAFNSNNLNVGTDNLFGNTGDGNGNNNNIERVDVVFSSGLQATSALAFAVFERGTTAAHDPFKIAAITGIDINGNPTSYGSLIAFGSGSTFGGYGTTDLVASTNWVVSRNDAASAGSPATLPSAHVTGQALGGVVVSVTGATGSSGLGIATNSTIYGYSLFGTDVTGTGGQILTDISTFPTNTSSTTGGGGIDLVAYTGVAMQAVPEPGSFVLLGATGLIVGLQRRRR